MDYQEFLATVRRRGEYWDTPEAERVMRAVLAALAERLDAGEVRVLSARLPQPVAALLTGHDGPAQHFGVEEFLRQVAERVGVSERTATWDASAVLSTVADGAAGGGLDDVLERLPSGFAVLFGRPSLAG